MWRDIYSEAGPSYWACLLVSVFIGINAWALFLF
jgi:hypothetical protein